MDLFHDVLVLVPSDGPLRNGLGIVLKCVGSLFDVHVAPAIRLFTVTVEAIVVGVDHDLVILRRCLLQLEFRNRRMTVRDRLNKNVFPFLEILLGTLEDHILIRSQLGHL